MSAEFTGPPASEIPARDTSKVDRSQRVQVLSRSPKEGRAAGDELAEITTDWADANQRPVDRHRRRRPLPCKAN